MNYETGRVRRQHVELATNPDDLHALEATLRLREQYGGTVTAVTMGPPQAAASLREVLATGADRGVLLCDERFAGADTLLTSRVLCAALKKLEPYDVVAAGCHSVDGNTGQVPVQVSQRAKIPLVKKVREMKLTGDAFWAKRNFGHEFQEITAPLPVMLGVDKYWNKPRIPTLAGIRRAYGKELSTWDAEELGFGLNFNCARDSPTRVLRVFPLRHARKNEVISGTVDQQVARVCEVLAAENVLVKRVRE
ncbi:MAG: electron transfer flavoprotein subunit beta [Promethearchaeota archaeon]